MLAMLGLPEAVRFRDALQLEGDPLAMLSRIPLARRIPLCVCTISEILYQSANQLILQEDNPTILDIACGYSPRVLLMAPKGYTYIGADLPDVTEDLMARRHDILPVDAECFAGYRTVDATDREHMSNVLAALRESMTIVTQGLLSYLDLDQKRQLAESIRELLSRDGGCWIIPDTDAETFLMDTFRAVLGDVAAGMVNQVYKVVDAAVKRDRSKMGWQSVNEMSEALEALGFAVRRVPLYREGMELRCLERLNENQARRLMDCWKQKSSLVVTLD
jgi:O-methyltransferase involved in polyketide biosynthesis